MPRIVSCFFCLFECNMWKKINKEIKFCFFVTKLIRVESPDGTKRIELSNETLRQLYLKVLQEFKLQPSPQIEWNLYLDRGKSNHLPNADHISVAEVISHGDMIYLLPTLLSVDAENVKPEKIEEDEVDQILSRQNGKKILK